MEAVAPGLSTNLMAATESISVPHLADAEVANTLRALVLRNDLPAEEGGRALDAWAGLGVSRVGSRGLLGRVWSLREHFTTYDATYVALAEALGCPLVTADARLAAAPGPTGQITVVRT